MFKDICLYASSVSRFAIISFYVFRILTRAAENRGVFQGLSAFRLYNRRYSVLNQGQFSETSGTIVSRRPWLNREYLRSEWKRIKSQHRLSDFESWLIVENLDSTSLSLSPIYTLSFENEQRPAALCQDLIFILRSVDQFRLWHCRLWSFKAMDTKLERFLQKNQYIQRKSLNFENWTNGRPQ